MAGTDKRKLSPDQIKAIETALNADARVEIIPVKDGVRVMKVTRNDIAPNKSVQSHGK